LNTNNQLVIVPGFGTSSAGKIKVGEQGQVKITLVIPSSVPTGTYRITSLLKDKTDNRELVNIPAVYFVDVT
jgi:hypothetical protein